MSQALLRKWCAAGAMALAAMAALPASAVAQAGSITGRVTDQTTGRPIESAQVNVVGTNLGGLTNTEGRFTIRGVAAGAHTVRVLRVGYSEQKRPVTVTAGAEATADFAMTSVAVTLTPVVTTATGQERRVEVGNSIAQIDAQKLVEQAPVANIGDLLTARSAGVQVLPGNQTGTGSRVRIRGSNSLSLSNDPIYIIDGIRMESTTNSASISVGGSVPDRVSDLNPEEIESIEVVKGPSAATLYGTDAANGVIVVRTKRGRAGRAQWNTYVEQGLVTDLNDYPTAYTSYGKFASGTVTNQCFNSRVGLPSTATNACTRDSVRTFNLFEDDEATPLSPGYRQQYGVQVSGGSEAVRYFAAGEYEDETGRFRMPEFARANIAARGLPLLDEWDRPNALNKASGRVNLSAALSPQADLNISTGYIVQSQRLPASDNNTIGLMSNALGGPGQKYGITGTDTTLYGYRSFTPDRMFQETVDQRVNRFIGSVNPNWRPTSWLSMRGNFGADFTSRVESDLCRYDTCVEAFEQNLGFKTNNRTTFRQYTVDLGSTATFQLRPTINSKTTAGVQYFKNLFERNGAFGQYLPPGGTTVSQGAVPGAAEISTETRTLGGFIEEALSFNDKLFLTAALRADDNSAFGANFSAVYYPKASVSWVLSEESFFPQMSWLNQLRLRGAWGASGVQPGTTDAVQFFIGRTVRVDDADQTGITFASIGNQDLKPERTQEIELGFDASLWNNRVNFEFTAYDKNSRDALVQRVVPPSVGTDSSVMFDNLGKVRNHGLEAMINAQLVQRRAFGWDVTLNGSTNKNKIISLGNVPNIIGNTIDQRAGYPLNAYFQYKYTYADADGNNLITANEITRSADREFIGYSMPRQEVTFQNGFDFFDRKLRVSALFDHKGGHKLYNNTDRIRCQSRNNCRGLNDPNAPLWDKARVVALREITGNPSSGFIEDASFIRFRELSATFNAPDAWAERFRARRFSATLAARNLALWTDFSGVDPESNYGQIDIPQNFQTAAPASLFTLRFNVGF